MKRPNITPGKWKKRTANGKTIVCREDSQTVGVPLDVCRVWQSSFTEANARAIAALPALLTALEALHAIGKDGVAMRHETGKPTWSALEETKKLTQAALIQAGYTF